MTFKDNSVWDNLCNSIIRVHCILTEYSKPIGWQIESAGRNGISESQFYKLCKHPRTLMYTFADTPARAKKKPLTDSVNKLMIPYFVPSYPSTYINANVSQFRCPNIAKYTFLKYIIDNSYGILLLSI